MFSMKVLEKQLKALANRRRLAIVKFLKKSNKASVGNIAREIKLSFKSTSRHLALLLAADIVDKEQVNLHMFYAINPSPSSVSKYIINLL